MNRQTLQQTKNCYYNGTATPSPPEATPSFSRGHRPIYGRIPAGGEVTTSFPNRPCSSSKGPAVKNRAFVGPAPAPFPKARAHRPSIAIGDPSAAWSWPRSCSSPLPSKRSRSNALMWPSPKFPTSRFPPNCPKSAGATASPPGVRERGLGFSPAMLEHARGHLPLYGAIVGRESGAFVLQRIHRTIAGLAGIHLQAIGFGGTPRERKFAGEGIAGA